MAPVPQQHGDLPVPAPTSWRPHLTDAPVLRNDLWEAMRSIPRGAWTVAVYGSYSNPKPVAMQEFVVDDFGGLAELSPDAAVANGQWYASTYAVDQAACEWMDQFTAPLASGSALKAMHDALRAARQQPASDDAVRAELLPQPMHWLHDATVAIDDDLSFDSRAERLISIRVQHDDNHYLVLTERQVRALAITLQRLVVEGVPPTAHAEAH